MSLITCACSALGQSCLLSFTPGVSGVVIVILESCSRLFLLKSPSIIFCCPSHISPARLSRVTRHPRQS